MAIALTGLLGEPLEKCREILAASATLQSLLGAGDAAAALDSIHAWEADEDLHAWPRVIVHQGPEFERQRAGTSLRASSGSFFVAFEFEVDTEAVGATTEADEHNWFASQLGAVLDEVEDLVGQDPGGGATSTYLNVHTVRLADGPWKNPPEEQNHPDPGSELLPRWWAVFLFEWGS